MLKNAGSQTIGAHLVSATDGSPFTGSASVFVTGDGGTQGAGAGSAPVSEGNGYHSYTPTAAETNFDHVAFTFTGSGAVSATVQVYTGTPQTGDNFARLGAPAGASMSADVAAVQTAVDGQNDLSAAQVNAEVDTALAEYDAPTKAEMDAGFAGQNDLSAAQVNAEVADVMNTDAQAEPSSVPAANSSIASKISFMYAMARNRRTTTATTDTIRNDANSADIGSATVSDDGTTFVRDEFS